MYSRSILTAEVLCRHFAYNNRLDSAMVRLRTMPLYPNSIIIYTWTMQDKSFVCLLFYVPCENFSLIKRRHINDGEGSLSCYIRCDTGPRFLWSHPNARPSLVAFYDRQGLLRNFSHPDAHRRIKYDKQWPSAWVLAIFIFDHFYIIGVSHIQQVENKLFAPILNKQLVHLSDR